MSEIYYNIFEPDCFRCVYKAGQSSQMSMHGKVFISLFLNRFGICSINYILRSEPILTAKVTDFQMWDKVLPDNLLIKVSHFYWPSERIMIKGRVDWMVHVCWMLWNDTGARSSPKATECLHFIFSNTISRLPIWSGDGVRGVPPGQLGFCATSGR